MWTSLFLFRVFSHRFPPENVVYKRVLRGSVATEMKRPAYYAKLADLSLLLDRSRRRAALESGYTNSVQESLATWRLQFLKRSFFPSVPPPSP